MTLPVYFYFRLCEFPVVSTVKQTWESPFMLMTPRGGCTFTTKARHAQMAGASALIIADATCLCSDKNCIANTTWRHEDNHTCQEYEPVVADDGSGGDISIPGFLLYKEDAVPLKEAIADKHQSLLMQIRWHKPKRERVHFGLWMDILDAYSNKLLKDIGPLVNALAGKNGHFSPHYMLHNGTKTYCGGDQSNRNESEPSLCQSMCTNNGRYCYPTHGNNGTAVVLEILRRTCIWNDYGPSFSKKKEGVAVGDRWWQYVSYFDEKCGNNFNNDKCVNDALKSASIPKNEIDSCMIDSGDPTGDGLNVLLDKVIRSQMEYGVTLAPKLTLGDHKVLKDPTADALLMEICDGSSGLNVCKQCLNNNDRIACVTKKYGTVKYGHSRKIFHFLLWVTVASIAYFAYKRYQVEWLTRYAPSGTNPMTYSMLQDQGSDLNLEEVN